MIRFFWYALVFITVSLGDRLSKAFFVNNFFSESLVINDYLSFGLAWNRGISWSMFQSASSGKLLLLTSIIALVILTFCVYTFIQYRFGCDITFEIMILAGATSNFVDRCWYGAVVDFIELHIHDWYWPSFNVADAAIVCGVIGITIKMVYNSYVNEH